jgi:hypothetical protein
MRLTFLKPILILTILYFLIVVSYPNSISLGWGVAIYLIVVLPLSSLLIRVALRYDWSIFKPTWTLVGTLVILLCALTLARFAFILVDHPMPFGKAVSCMTGSWDCFKSFAGIGFPAFYKPPYGAGDVHFPTYFSIPFLLINLSAAYIGAAAFNGWLLKKRRP